MTSSSDSNLLRQIMAAKVQLVAVPKAINILDNYDTMVSGCDTDVSTSLEGLARDLC